MRKPGVNPNNVQMADVLCDFCLQEWREDMPLIEGHQGSCICGPCLTQAWQDVAAGRNTLTHGYTCPMCRESGEDRASLDRAGEPGWQSPKGNRAVICTRCMKLAATALEKDPDFEWARPV